VLDIHTIAAGGGSILFANEGRYRVGPESAGSNPGPASYRRGGPLAVTDANVMLGKIHPQYFPAVFGVEGNLPLDREIVVQKFTELATDRSPEQVAAGFVAIAVENMANAIKKISLQRGYDVTQYALCCFGGAGAQMACLIANTLGMKKIFLHPYAGVLSAYGMGLAEVRSMREGAIEQPLSTALTALPQILKTLETQARAELTEVTNSEQISCKVNLKYEGTNSTLAIGFATDETVMREAFEREHKSRYGFIQPEKDLIVESVSVEVIQTMETPEEPLLVRTTDERPQAIETVRLFTQDQWFETPVYRREDLQSRDRISGPAIIVEKISTIVVEPDWDASLTERNHLILTSNCHPPD
jgi:5-oxoprolinase (ATP-hydrolysing)